jgi:beta-lactamase class A
VTDQQASLEPLREALYQPHDRAVQLQFVEQPAPAWGMYLLESEIKKQLDSFEGFGSVFVLDLQTGEEIGINADVAVSALSLLKIAIFVETYRTLDQPPDEYVQGLLTETAIHSSNHSANLLLHVIAGEDNTYRGADVLTQYMRDLGLTNTFMAVPYDAAEVATRPTTYQTPANSRSDISINPDPARQTTTEELGTMLAMLYYCAEGQGGFLAVYPEEITAEECQAIVDLMIRNEEGNLIRYGVPEGVPVSHKHGWDFTQHGDAGIVYSPNGDFVIVIILAQPESDWMSSEYSFPIIQEIARATYNYFNFDQPNLDSALDGIDRVPSPLAEPIDTSR